MDTLTYIKAFLGLAIVLGLILGLSYGLKRLGFGDLKGPLGRRRRLATVEALMIDGRNKAVLLRRDGVEHLVLIGPNTSQVIESGIPAPLAALPDASGETPAEPSFASRLSQWMKP